MGTSSTPGQRRKYSRTIRFSGEELSLIAQRMRLVGQTNFSKFARASLLGKPISVSHRVPVPRSLINELSAIGNNINQIARLANTDHVATFEMVAEAVALLKEVRTVIENELGRAHGSSENGEDTRGT
ncbi:MAG: MobC family plasmid mobilization relaxosome protein [Arcanobacterium sp.]